MAYPTIHDFIRVAAIGTKSASFDKQLRDRNYEPIVYNSNSLDDGERQFTEEYQLTIPSEGANTSLRQGYAVLLRDYFYDLEGNKIPDIEYLIKFTKKEKIFRVFFKPAKNYKSLKSMFNSLVDKEQIKVDGMTYGIREVE